MELEYKFNLNDELAAVCGSESDWSDWLHSRLYADPDLSRSLTLSDWRSIPMEALQYDSPDLALAREWTALRLRREGEQVRLTLKAETQRGESAAGRSERLEWEETVSLKVDPVPTGETLQRYIQQLLEAHRHEAAHKPLSMLLRQPLALSGRLAFDRKQVLLRQGELELIWSVDSGSMSAGGREAAIAETEFELLQGSVTAFDQLVLQLADRLALSALPLSKNQRLQQLAHPQLLIVGGGPAGMAAAIAAREENEQSQVLLLERMPACGRKLNATGNGRGNLTHTGELASHYHSVASSPEWIERHTERWSSEALRQWLAAHGLATEADAAGRVYPLSQQAKSITRLLTALAEEKGVIMQTDAAVTELQRLPGRSPLWQVLTADGRRFFAERLIMAAGGTAQPKLGSDGSGWELLRSLQLPITPVYPALVQLTCSHWSKRLSGLRLAARLRLGEAHTEGELLLTDYGLSGIVTLELSLLCSQALANGRTHEVEIDTVPELNLPDICAVLGTRRRSLSQQAAAAWAEGLVPDKLAAVLAEQLGLEGTLEQQTDQALERFAQTLKSWRVTVNGTKGMATAQVSLGGLPLDELTPGSCAVNRIPGLYVCGEILDLTGETGGYNLHLALSSGLACGQEAAGPS